MEGLETRKNYCFELIVFDRFGIFIKSNTFLTLFQERTGTAYFGIEARHRRWQKKLQLTSEHAKLVEESEIRQHMLNESRNAQNIDKSSGPGSNVVKHELIFPLKHSTVWLRMKSNISSRDLAQESDE